MIRSSDIPVRGIQQLRQECLNYVTPRSKMTFFEKIQSKITDLEMATFMVKQWKAKGGRVVFTNGCFDLIHYGHLQYLAAAKDLGHRLMVGVNSDASIRRIKGEGRPVKDQQTRLHLLASLACVDAVILFEKDTPTHLIETLQPDVLVKGGDWPIEKIVGASIVLGAGGEVYSLPFVEGFSTTKYVDKMKMNK